MKLDILVFSAHPDDAELGCGGTIAKAVASGRQVGIADLTRGELGTRGTVEIREKEAAAARDILGLSVRENLGFRDGFFANDESHRLALIELIRKYQPEIVLAAAPNDRHPDHPRASELIVEACFLSGLLRVETDQAGVSQAPWRPAVLYHYIQSVFLTPDFVVDVSQQWDTKMKAINAYVSQFTNGGADPETYISNPRFLRMVEARAIELGHSIGVNYGEGFITNRNLGVGDLFDLI
ncbi:MAG: bacillithiol biosynthesis deacetylase BshB1 [Cyclobacteriaceae bacterium]|nr:MAG: bacillithiol biosynthesis deacetylase BshB1 [Cyclobacteriaceae bacterium]